MTTYAAWVNGTRYEAEGATKAQAKQRIREQIVVATGRLPAASRVTVFAVEEES